jgi:Ethanolamine utilization protein EutJ (predicted chaperonin)
MELVISAMESSDKPTVLFGFHSPEFSQCVYMTVDEDPIACLKMAEQLADGLVKACGEAVQKYRKAQDAEATGSASQASGSEETPNGEAG